MQPLAGIVRAFAVGAALALGALSGCVRNDSGSADGDPNDPNALGGIGPITGEDRDGDGLSNADEAVLGTDPDNPDTDGDGLSDGREVELELNPLSADTLTAVVGPLCATLVEASGGELFQVSSANAAAGWRAGEVLVFAGGTLVNVSRGESLAATRYGAERTRSRLQRITTTATTLLLFDGSLWIYEDAGRATVSTWRETGDEILVVDRGGTELTLINLTNCTAVPGRVGS